ncbi:UNVERIFIED_CONTAM: hypothetical protein FKN15_052599 [Acipenser sinensis]
MDRKGLKTLRRAETHTNPKQLFLHSERQKSIRTCLGLSIRGPITSLAVRGRTGVGGLPVVGVALLAVGLGRGLGIALACLGTVRAIAMGEEKERKLMTKEIEKADCKSLPKPIVRQANYRQVPINLLGCLNLGLTTCLTEEHKGTTRTSCLNLGLTTCLTEEHKGTTRTSK